MITFVCYGFIIVINFTDPIKKSSRNKFATEDDNVYFISVHSGKQLEHIVSGSLSAVLFVFGSKSKLLNNPETMKCMM